jgi:hypothetical protein
MRFLQRNAKVSTRYGGGFVQSIDGRAGDRQDGRPVDWFYYVNGVLADQGAASTRLRAGDVVWWDRHDWGATGGTTVVVGSFPEPFVHGTGGRRPAVQLACAVVGDASCRAAGTALSRAGVHATTIGLTAPPSAHAMRILVGTYVALRADRTARTLERGVQVSGVYARPSADGRTIAVLDARGRVARTLDAGSGMIAATRRASRPPVWIVTGVDRAGVAAAAAALTPARLQHRFALVVSGHRDLSAPLTGATS